METLAKNIANNIALQMNYDEDKKAVIAYGLTAIFQMAFILVVISIIGLLFDFWYESIIIYLGVGIIRKSTGGAHSQTMFGCTLISILAISILSTLSRYLLGFPIQITINLGISLFVYMLCFIIFYIRVPVDSPNKPIVKPEKIRRLRKQSFFVLTILLLVSFAFSFFAIQNDRFYSLTMSIRLMMLWQLFTLTKTGIKLLSKLDTKLKALTAAIGI